MEKDRDVVVLLSAYLDKQNPVFGGFRRRYVVLTHEALHWFKRDEHDHLFGDERGQIKLIAMEVVRILDEDPSTFEIISSNFTNRHFRCASESECEEWVSALRSAIKKNTVRKRKRSKSLFNSAGQKYLTADMADEHSASKLNNDIKVLLVSIGEPDKHEAVIARNPDWGRLIILHNVCPNDEVVISISNGGTVKLTSTILQDKATVGGSFQIDIKDVLLASSLQIVLKEAVVPGQQEVVVPASDKNKDGWLFNLKLFFQKITGDTATVEKVILSLMTITTGVSLLPHFISRSTSLQYRDDLDHVIHGSNVANGGLQCPVDSSWILFASIAFVLAVHSFCLVYMSIKRIEEEKSKRKGESYHMYIIEHQFTSPDAPVKVPDDSIPQRFLNGCDGDVREARRRWDITRRWREEEGINDILNEAQPNFKTIKTMYPHYVCSKSSEGVYAYYERPGEIEVQQLAARGIGVNEMLRHWLYCTEFFYTYFAKGELDKCITVLDLNGMSMSDVKGDPLDFVRKTVGYANQHYPERAHCIFLVNVPGWFSWIYKILKPLIHENTQKKVKILSKKEVLDGLKEHIDISQIPVYYGGELDFEIGDKRGHGNDSCRFYSPEEVFMAKMTDRLNRRCAGENVSDDEIEYKENATDKCGETTKLNPSDENSVADTQESQSSTDDSSIISARASLLPPTPRTSGNSQKMQMHLQKSTISGRVQSDDWSVSSIGQNTVSSPAKTPLPPQTKRRKPFSAR